MVQLAASLVMELGLWRSSALPLANNQNTESSFGAYMEDVPVPREPTLDERRALLGLDVMSSVCVTSYVLLQSRRKLTSFPSVNTFVQTTDAVRYNNEFTEECLRVFELRSEHTSDQYLIQLVRLQKLAEEINQALPRYRQDVNWGPAAPIASWMKTLQAKLEHFRMKLPLDLQQNRMSICRFYTFYHMLIGFQRTYLCIITACSHT